MDSSHRIDDQQGLVLEPSNELRFKGRSLIVIVCQLVVLWICLCFQGPFDDFVTVTLSIRNPTEKRIAFKIKTTAPKRYCVKPNSGVLDPSSSTKVNGEFEVLDSAQTGQLTSFLFILNTIQVLLQPFTYDPNDKTKHKFMVQYVYLSEEESRLSAADMVCFSGFSLT
jgi:hypothetical protein